MQGEATGGRSKNEMETTQQHSTPLPPPFFSSHRSGFSVLPVDFESFMMELQSSFSYLPQTPRISLSLSLSLSLRRRRRRRDGGSLQIRQLHQRQIVTGGLLSSFSLFFRLVKVLQLDKVTNGGERRGEKKKRRVTVATPPSFLLSVVALITFALCM